MVFIPEQESNQATSNTELLARPEFTNAVKSVVMEESPTGEHVWKFHGSDYESLSQTYSFSVVETQYGIEVSTDLQGFGTGYDARNKIQNIYSNCFYLSENADYPSPNFWVEKVYVYTNNLGFVKQSEVEHLQDAPLNARIADVATGAFANTVTGVVEAVMTNKVWAEWKFFPTNDYSVSHDLMFTDEGTEYATTNVIWKLILGGEVVGEYLDSYELADPSKIEYILFDPPNVVARRKKVNALKIATLDDVQGLTLDEVSIGVNSLGELEIKGFGAAESLPTNAAVFVKDGANGGTWKTISQLIDPDTLYISDDGKICARDYSRCHPWVWCPENRNFTNCVVQLTRSIGTYHFSSATEYVIDPNGDGNVIEQSSIAPLPTTGVYFVSVFHETRGVRLNVITLPNATRESIVAMRFKTPRGGELKSDFYVGTIFQNEQVDGVYAMPTCFLWE